MFWNNTYSDNGMNILVVSLGDKAAKEYCEIEMLKKKQKMPALASAPPSTLSRASALTTSLSSRSRDATWPWLRAPSWRSTATNRVTWTKCRKTLSQRQSRPSGMPVSTMPWRRTLLVF